MSDLITCTLEDICLKEKGSIISGPFGSNISSKYFVSSGIPVIRGNNLTTDHIKFIDDGFVYVTEEKANELHCDAYADDLIFTAAGTIGQVGIIPKNTKYNRYVISNKQIRVRLDTELVDLDYAYCWFVSPWIQTALKNNNKGSTVPLLTLAEVRSLPITYPKDKGEQKAIAKVFNDLDAKIDNNVAICSDLEAIAKLLYDYWFVQFDFPDENGKPYKSSGGKMVWNEELKREIPEGWEVVPYSEVISSINTGLNPRDNFRLNTGGQIKYLTVKNLLPNGNIDFSACDLIDEEARRIVHKRSDIKIGDILFASISPLGRCHIIWNKPENWDINESVFSIRPDYNKVNSAFLYLSFTSDYFIKLAEGNSTGSVFKGIRITELLGLKTILPPKPLLDKFNEYVYGLFDLKSNTMIENQELASLRDFLLPMLMNGQVKVKKEDANE